MRRDINVVTRRRRLHDAGVAAEKAGYIMAKGAGFVPGPAEPEQLSVLPVQSLEEVTV